MNIHYGITDSPPLSADSFTSRGVNTIGEGNSERLPSSPPPSSFSSSSSFSSCSSSAASTTVTEASTPSSVGILRRRLSSGAGHKLFANALSDMAGSGGGIHSYPRSNLSPSPTYGPVLSTPLNSGATSLHVEIDRSTATGRVVSSPTSVASHPSRISTLPSFSLGETSPSTVSSSAAGLKPTRTLSTAASIASPPPSSLTPSISQIGGDGKRRISVVKHVNRQDRHDSQDLSSRSPRSEVKDRDRNKETTERRRDDDNGSVGIALSQCAKNAKVKKRSPSRERIHEDNRDGCEKVNETRDNRLANDDISTHPKSPRSTSSPSSSASSSSSTSSASSLPSSFLGKRKQRGSHDGVPHPSSPVHVSSSDGMSKRRNVNGEKKWSASLSITKPCVSLSSTSSSSSGPAVSSSPKDSIRREKERDRRREELKKRAEGELAKREERKPSSVIQLIPKDMQEYTNRPWVPTNVLKGYVTMGSEIGKGTYGIVTKALRTKEEDGSLCNREVVLKRIRKEFISLGEGKSSEGKMVPEGLPLTAVREIRFLTAFSKVQDCNNIVRLFRVVTTHEGGHPEALKQKKKKSAPLGAATGGILPPGDLFSNFVEGSTFMEFEKMDHDLLGIRKDERAIDDAQIRYYMRGILTGLHQCHKAKVLHRDIKEANILISNNGDVKLADFGLARQLPQAKEGISNSQRDHRQHMTGGVVTLWFRSPELCLGANHYDGAIDIWAAGCCFGHMLLKRELFQGSERSHGGGDISQFHAIVSICGFPEEKTWPGVEKFEVYKRFQPATPKPRRLREILSKEGIREHAIDLLDKMLTMDPKQRITAEEALMHPYFFDPKCIDKDTYVRIYGKKYGDSNCNELSVKQKQSSKRRIENTALPRPPSAHGVLSAMRGMDSNNNQQFQNVHQQQVPLSTLGTHPSTSMHNQVVQNQQSAKNQSNQQQNQQQHYQQQQQQQEQRQHHHHHSHQQQQHHHQPQVHQQQQQLEQQQHLHNLHEPYISSNESLPAPFLPPFVPSLASQTSSLYQGTQELRQSYASIASGGDHRRATQHSFPPSNLPSQPQRQPSWAAVAGRPGPIPPINSASRVPAPSIQLSRPTNVPRQGPPARGIMVSYELESPPLAASQPTPGSDMVSLDLGSVSSAPIMSTSASASSHPHLTSYSAPGQRARVPSKSIQFNLKGAESRK